MMAKMMHDDFETWIRDCARGCMDEDEINNICRGALDFDGGCYHFIDPTVQAQWLAWQAAIESTKSDTTSATAMECFLGVKFKFWTCPTCESPTIKWNGNKAWCVACGRSNDDTVCVCGEPSITNGHGKYIGCCQTCLPF